MNDARELNALAVKSYVHFIPIMNAIPAPMLADHHALVREQEVWLLRSHREIEASLVLIAEDGYLLVESIAVDPGHQGGGKGRLLLEWAKCRARESGFGELRLYTNVHMTRNRAWYRREGFEETREEQRGDKHIVHMRLLL